MAVWHLRNSLGGVMSCELRNDSASERLARPDLQGRRAAVFAAPQERRTGALRRRSVEAGQPARWVDGVERRRVMIMPALALFIGLIAAGFAMATDYSGVFGFVRRWMMCIAIIVGLIAAGVALGRIAYSAMCAGPWLCTQP
jgi:hypothetical protein